MTADSVFNAYLDVNIILLLAAGLWALTRSVMARTRLRQAFSIQLLVLYGVLLAVFFAPVVVVLHGISKQMGLWPASSTPSIPDYALAQYLNGRFDMSPTTFETLWMSRTVFTQNVVSLGSSFTTALVVLAGLGFVWYSARLSRNALRIRNLIQRSYCLRRLRGVEIRLSDLIAVPFSTRGWRGQYVVLPSALLSEADDLRIATAHELQHMRQGDLAWEILLEFARPFFFWNPAFAYFKRDVEELRELACDQQVLLRQRFNVNDYCDCLLRVCRNVLSQGSLRHVLVPGVPFVPSERNRRATRFLRRRVVSMVSEGRSLPRRWLAGILTLPLVIVICLGSIAVQSSGEWSQDRLMLSTIVNLERLDQRTLSTRY